MSRILIPSVFLFLISFAAAEAMATSGLFVGNEPLPEQQFTGWPGVMPLVNDVHRVYGTEFQRMAAPTERSGFQDPGHMQLYYRGDTSALNNALRKFAAVKAEVHKVVLQPGPGVHNLGGKETVQVNWSLYLAFPDKNPVLTVYVGGDIPFEKIEIPKGVKVVDERQLRGRGRDGR
jgi:hypothetical protein